MTLIETPPPVTPAVGWTFPTYTERRLDNGLRVLRYDCPGQYVVAATVLFDLPLTAEPPELEGVAGLVGRCLTRGAAGRTAEEFADALALCGADLDASAFPDGFAVRLAVPMINLDKALRLMADAIRSPEFYDDEFDHEKDLRLEEIEQAAAYPQHVAVEQLNGALFGDHRAARPVGGTAESVTAVSRDDAVAFAQGHLDPERATLIIAGDFAGLDPVALIAEAFEGWAGSAPPTAADATPPPVPADHAQVILVDWPTAPQSTLRLAAPGITRGDARWAGLFAANFTIGGTFSSRINTVLREEKGFTYGAGSSLDTGRDAGLITVSTAVRADSTAEALGDIVTILRAATGSITDDEVSTAARAATESAALGFERADSVVGRVELLVSQGLPLDHVDTNLERIRRVTAGEANSALETTLRPDAFTVVVVGDAASLREPLAEWGYAPVVEVTPTRR
ncbi:MAG: pitrilysin family protein [Nocardioidaceae bacterium]